MPAGRPPKYTSPDEMQRLIDLYFLACKSRMLEDGARYLEDLSEDDLSIVNDVEGSIPTVSGLAYHLGMSTEALRNYEDKDEFLATVKKAKQRVEVFLENRLHAGQPTGAIFNLKNNFGWKDKLEQELSYQRS